MKLFFNDNISFYVKNLDQVYVMNERQLCIGGWIVHPIVNSGCGDNGVDQYSFMCLTSFNRHQCHIKN